MKTSVNLHVRDNILRPLVALGFLLLISAPIGSAQYGTQLKAGDYGHIPVTKGASVAVKVLYGDMGITGDTRDDCVYFDVTSPTTLNNGLTNKDLRITKCGEMLPGTAITDADTVERAFTPVYTPVSVRYHDANINAKYDKGDFVYITTNTVADTNLAVTTSPTQWTLRLTPAMAYGAGTILRPTDTDWEMVKSTVVVLASSIVEREDSVWFLIAHGTAVAPYDAKGAMVLGDSLRINSNALFQPAFKVNKLDMDSTTLAAGASFTGKAEIQNTGKGAGQGIVVSKVNGVIVDAQLTPYLSPGEKGTMTMKGFAPMAGSFASFEVGDQFKQITILNGTQPTTMDANELLSRLTALETELAQLREAKLIADNETEVIKAAQAANAGGAAPGVDFALLVVAVAGVFLLRRRA